jgi:hypothetical protein
MPSVRRSMVVVTKLMALRSAAMKKRSANSPDIDAGIRGRK